MSRNNSTTPRLDTISIPSSNSTLPHSPITPLNHHPEFEYSQPSSPISENVSVLQQPMDDKERIQVLEEQVQLLAMEASKAGMFTIYSC